MKTYVSKPLLIVPGLIFQICLINGQNESIEQVTIFGNRTKMPIEMDVKTDQGNIVFNVIDKSYFPYNFEIEFGEFQNLSPRVLEKKTIVFPGINRLFTFKIVDQRESPRFSYQIKFYIAKTNELSDISFPYLIPIGENKTVSLMSKTENGFTTFYENRFVMGAGDTVFASRKGIVTAVPGEREDVDRIFKNSSLEIRHNDGTIAIYIGLDPGTKFIRPGQFVYPGQPVGVIGSYKLLIFGVYELRNDGTVKNLSINYSGENGELILSARVNKTRVFYTEATIKKELTRREVSKFEKRSLY